MRPETGKKLENLNHFIQQFEKVLIAFSGGVDSSTLAAVCSNAGVEVLAVTVLSSVSPRREMEEAKRIAEELGVRHEFLKIDLMDEDFRRNDENRCYYCKRRVLSALVEEAKKRGIEVVLEGTNASDLSDHRPGYRAVRELDGVNSPWVEFGITKEEIREIARSMGYSFHDKPSMACLASRIPFGIEIDEGKLKMVDEAEEAVIELAGVKQVRVRNYDGVAVVEVAGDELKKLLNCAEKVRDKLKKIGFRAVLIDLEGYRSGKRLFKF
ncbi:hypothetical protein AFULGI_00018090 [Archaeoglobus fulgidus DSM 8774]|jgi:uncharacterized protein|uniref:TIGR00268 family protein n=1 Tax=Archaeoglobus fulgidus DSM 8774 TaxID=1344584 RepID=A0A075WF22_ARCFL|nr:ATP-dependent sacrificial sulfur transferase LarE [Archaeoglobus fulgidus]AIG98566.1 hypothetical protein AFULGI_00018090 [Archaeoglobus fulgidus DSM 8774]